MFVLNHVGLIVVMYVTLFTALKLSHSFLPRAAVDFIPFWALQPRYNVVEAFIMRASGVPYAEWRRRYCTVTAQCRCCGCSCGLGYQYNLAGGTLCIMRG